jgi:hypothetical protein
VRDEVHWCSDCDYGPGIEQHKTILVVVGECLPSAMLLAGSPQCAHTNLQLGEIGLAKVWVMRSWTNWDIYGDRHIHIYIYIYNTVNPLLGSTAERTLNLVCNTRKHTQSALCARIGRAPQPLGARNHCSGVPRSHSALEITARNPFRDASSSALLRAVPCATSQALSGASKQLSNRNRGSSKRRWIRQNIRGGRPCFTALQ